MKNCDNANVNASRLAHTGGNWNNGSNTGAFHLNANNSASNTNPNIGSHLKFSKQSSLIYPKPMMLNPFLKNRLRVLVWIAV